MELDATTFTLEVINFLVLLWLMNRFFFRPMRAAMLKQSDAEQQQAQALTQGRAELQAGQDALREQQAQMAQAREQARAQLHEEITALRASQMDELNAELAAERAKSQARLEQERQRMCDQSEQTLRSRAGGILANYLQRLASPALEASVVELFLSDLAERRAEVTQALAQDGALTSGSDLAVHIATAYPPGAEQMQRVEAALRGVLPRSASMQWSIDPALISGISVHLCGHLMEASLQRGLDALDPEPISGVH